MVIVGICDDVKLERKHTRQLCEDIFSEESMEYLFVMFADGAEVLAYEGAIDVLLLDIEMDGKNGIEVKNSLLAEEKNTVIFYVSSHSEMFRETYGKNVYGFLVKADEGFINKNELAALFEQYFEMKREPKIIKVEEEFVSSDKIVYIVAEDMYCSLRLQSGEQKLLRKPIRILEQELSENDFVRIHRKYMINMHFIQKCESATVMVSDKELSIGRKYRSEWKEKYKMYCKRNARYC